MKARKRKKLWLIPLTVLAVVIMVFVIYVSDYYRADAEAMATIPGVAVTRTEHGWFFDGEGDDDLLVFYPGGKVEETAYTPFLSLLAEKGLDVCLVKMPFHLAFLDADAAGDVLAEYSYGHYYVGGHSLGGAMAASFAAENPGAVEGVVLCAAYASKALPEDVTEVVVYGSEDGVLNMESVEKGRAFAPENYTEHVIEGGNHAQFGSYGIQKGDGTASITPQAQMREAAEIIAGALLREN